MRFITGLLLVAAATLGAEPSEVTAQPKAAVHPVTVVSDGQLFTVEVKIDSTKKTDKGTLVHPMPAIPQPQPPAPKAGAKALPRVPDKLGEKEITKVTPGLHTFHVKCAVGCVADPLGSCFPQPVMYRVTGVGGYEWKSEPTTDPVAIDVKPGQKVFIHALRPQESFNSKFGSLYGVPVALVLERPYWSQGLAAKKGETEEPLPNSLTFLVSKDWGCPKVTTDLAASAMENMQNGNFATPGSYSTHYFRAVVALDFQGKVPEAIFKIAGKDRDKKQVEKDLRVELGKLCGAWRTEKCYTLNPIHAQALRKDGMLPDALGDGPLPAAEALKLAEPMLTKWEQK